MCEKPALYFTSKYLGVTSENNTIVKLNFFKGGPNHGLFFIREKDFDIDRIRTGIIAEENLTHWRQTFFAKQFIHFIKRDTK